MSAFMLDFGISLINFSVNNISADERDESYKKVKEAMAAAAKLRWSETAKADMEAYNTRTVGTAKADVIGYEQEKANYTYQQKRSFDVMESAASNESGTHNEFMGMGMELAMGNKMGTVVGTQIENMVAVMDVGDICNYQKSSQIIKFAGVAPCHYESGQFTAQHTAITKKGSQYLRKTLYQIILPAINNNEVFRTYYNKKSTEGKGHRCAQEHCIRKLLRVISWCK